MNADFQAGSRVGDYILDAQMGSGSFGTIWRGHVESTGQTVAVKLLVGALSSDDSASMRSDVEVLAAAAGAHSQHVVQVLGGGSSPVPFIVMEFIEGQDLQALLASAGKLTFRQTIDFGIAISDALRALYDAGIIHRDIKPANVMIDSSGVIKLTDFGIAKIVGYEALTTTGQTAMTMAYAAPEAWDEGGPFGRPTNKTDLYAMGVVLYQCLAGAPPFSGNYGTLYRAHMEESPAYSALPPDVPPSLRILIRKCLEKRQEDRPRNAAECIAMLRRAEAELAAAEGRPTNEPRRFGPWVQDAPHEDMIWAWRCHHESTGEKATVEVHFADSLDYGERLHRTVAANAALAPFGAERLIATNRLLLHPNESWYEPPAGQFQFWVAREDLPKTPAATVSTPTLLATATALSKLIAAAKQEGVSLSLRSGQTSVAADGSVYVRRPGLVEGEPDQAAAATNFLRSLPLDAAARQTLDANTSLESLIELTAAPATVLLDATRIVRAEPPPDATVRLPAAEPPRSVTPPSIPAAAPPSRPPVAPAVPAPASPRRPPWLLFAGGAGVLAAGVIAAALLLSGGGKDNNPPADQAQVEQTPAPTAQATTIAPTPVLVPVLAAATPGTGAAGALDEGLLFLSARDGHDEIYVMNADGSNALRLTQGASSNRLPNALADGSRIAFVSDRNGGSELFIMNGDGTGQTLITTAPGDKLEPNLSPDGKRIVFEVKAGDNYEIYTVNVDGTELVNLTKSISADIDPVWSPDGKRIVFGSNRNGNMDIYTMNADGTGARQLTNSPSFNGEPAWSPNGKQIIFESDRRGNYDLYVMNDDGTALTRLTDDPGDEYDPAWSPDGSRIAYTGVSAGKQGAIYIVNSDGSQPRNISKTTARDYKPAWTRVKRPG